MALLCGRRVIVVLVERFVLSQLLCCQEATLTKMADNVLCEESLEQKGNEGKRREWGDY